MESSKLTFPDNRFLLEYRGSDFKEEHEKSMVKINLPQPLARFTEGATVELQANTVGELFTKLIEKYPDVEKRLIAADGELNKFVNVFVNDEDIRFLNGKNTPLKETDEVTVVPAVAGG